MIKSKTDLEKKKKLGQRILRGLRKLRPDAKKALKYKNNMRLLGAVIMSAQSCILFLYFRAIFASGRSFRSPLKILCPSFFFFSRSVLDLIMFSPYIRYHRFDLRWFIATI